MRVGEVTAVFAANDYLATGILRAFWGAGLDVPTDVSVIGFDDLQISNFLIPSLTTVRQPFRDVGHAALTKLLEGDTADTSPKAIAPTLVMRASTAPPKSQ